MDTRATDAADPRLAKRRSIIVSLVGAALAVLVGILIGVLWKARGWPHRLDASMGGFFLIMAIVQGVFLPSRRPRAHAILFAFVVSAAAWLALHFLNAGLQAAR
jgi:hypothetical protein